MITLADTTALLEQTTAQLADSSGTLTPQAGIALVDQWLEPLGAAENLQPIAKTLSELKEQLQAGQPDVAAVQSLMSELSEQTTQFATTVGSEGEMPSLLEGLSAALRQAGDVSKADQT